MTMAVAALREVLLATLLLACLHAAYSYHTGDRKPEGKLDDSMKKQKLRDGRYNVWDKMMSSHRRFLQDKAQQHEDKVERDANWKLKRKKLLLNAQETDTPSNTTKKWTPDDLGWTRKDLHDLLKIPRNRRSELSHLRWPMQGGRRDYGRFSITSSWSFGAGLTEFYGAGGSTGIARPNGDAMTLFNTLYPGFGQTGEWILQPQDELFQNRKRSGPIDIDVLKSQLWASTILRDNMVTVFGYVINFPNNPLRTELYTSLVLLYDIIRFRRIQTVELVPVLRKMASACPRNQFLYLFQRMRTVVPKYMHSSVSVWIDALKRRDVDIDSFVRPRGGPLVVDFLAGIDSSVLDSLDEDVNFQESTVENASPYIADTMGHLLANVFSALSDGSLTLTQDLFALIMLHRPLNLMLPQREETERYLIDILRLKNVDHWGSIIKSLKRKHFKNPIKLIRLILTRISMHKDIDPLIQEDARYVLQYVEEPLVTFVNGAYNLASPVMSKPTIDLLELLKSIMPIEYPDEVLELKTRIEYYILNGYLDIEFVIKGFNRFDHLRPVDLLIAILTRIHRRLPKLPHEIISSVKYLKLYLIFKRFLCSMSSTVPTDLVDISSLVDAFDGPKMPKRIINVVQKLAANLPYEEVSWTDLAKETPIEECSRPRQCIRSIFKRVIKKGILEGRPSLEYMEELLKLLDEQGDPLPEETSSKAQLTDRNRNENLNNEHQDSKYETTQLPPPSKSVTDLCYKHGFARVGTCVRPCESSEITTPKNQESATGKIPVLSSTFSTKKPSLKVSTSETNSYSTNSNDDTSTTERNSVPTSPHNITPTGTSTLSTSTQTSFGTMTPESENAGDTETPPPDVTMVTEIDKPNVTQSSGKITRLKNEGKKTEKDQTTGSVSTLHDEITTVQDIQTCDCQSSDETDHNLASETSESTLEVTTKTTPLIEITSTGASNTYLDVSEDSTTPQFPTELGTLTSTESSSEYFRFGTDDSSIPDSVASSDQENTLMRMSETTEWSETESTATPFSETLSVETGSYTGESSTFSSLSETEFGTSSISLQSELSSDTDFSTTEASSETVTHETSLGEFSTSSTLQENDLSTPTMPSSSGEWETASEDWTDESVTQPTDEYSESSEENSTYPESSSNVPENYLSTSTVLPTSAEWETDFGDWTEESVTEPTGDSSESSEFSTNPESSSYPTEETIDVTTETVNNIPSEPSGDQSTTWELSTESSGTIFEEVSSTSETAESFSRSTVESSATSTLSSTLYSTKETMEYVYSFTETTPRDVSGYTSDEYFSNFSSSSAFSLSSFWNASYSSNKNKFSMSSTTESMLETQPTNLEHTQAQFSSDIMNFSDASTQHTIPVETVVNDQVLSTSMDSSSTTDDSLEWTSESGMDIISKHPKTTISSSETYPKTEIPFYPFNSTPSFPLEGRVNASDKSATSYSPHSYDIWNKSTVSAPSVQEEGTEFTDTVSVTTATSSYFSETSISTEEFGVSTSESSSSEWTSNGWVSDLTETSAEISSSTTDQKMEGTASSDSVNNAVSESWYPTVSDPKYDRGGTNESSVTLELPGFSKVRQSPNTLSTPDAQLTSSAGTNKRKTAMSLATDTASQNLPVTEGHVKRETWSSPSSEYSLGKIRISVPNKNWIGIMGWPKNNTRTKSTSTTPNTLSPIFMPSTNSMSMQAFSESQDYKPELGCKNFQDNCTEDVPSSSIVYEGPKMKKINLTAIYPPDFLPPNHMFVQGRFVFIGQYAQYGLVQQGGVGNEATLQMWKQYQQQNSFNTYFGSPISININNINIQNVQQNVVNTDVRLPIMNPLVQHEPACSAYPETLIPLTEPGSLQDMKLRPLRTFLSNPYLYSILGPRFKPESYLKKGPLLEAILTQALKVIEVRSDMILKTTIEQYLHEIKMERSKPDKPKVVVNFACLVNALPYPQDENEAATIGMVRAYLSQPDLYKTVNHLVNAVKYNTKGLMLKHVLHISLNLTSVQSDEQLFNAIKSAIDGVYMNGYGAQAVEWVLVEEHKGEMSIDVFSLFSTLDMRNLRQHPNGRDALQKVLNFVVHDFHSSIYFDGFDMTQYKTKGTLLEGAFQFLLKQNAISPKLKESFKLLISFIKFDGVGATPITYELD